MCIHRFHWVQNCTIVSGCKMHTVQTIFANACIEAIVLANKTIQLQHTTNLNSRKKPYTAVISYFESIFKRLFVYAWFGIITVTIFVTNTPFVGAIHCDDNAFFPTEYGITSKK